MKAHLKSGAPAALLFASFMFLQLIILRMGNQAGQGFLPAGQQELVYVFLQVFVICGILLHALLRSALKSSPALRATGTFALALCAVCSAYMLFAPVDSALYLAVTFIAVFCLGFTAGAVYLRMSEYCGASLPVGASMGVGYSAALLLQFLFQLQWLIRPAVAVLALGAFVLLGSLILRRGPEAGEPAEVSSPGKLISACVIASALLLFTAFYSGYIHHLQVASGYGTYNVYTWPRLLMIPGMLVFGLLGDYKKGRYLPLVTLCFSVLAFLNSALAGKADAYRLNMCLYYISLSAAVAYYNLTFWHLAPGTKNPALWSAAGRMLDSLIVIPLCLVSLTEASAGVVLSLNIAALVTIIVLMAVNGDFDLSGGRTKAPDLTMSEDEALACLARRYSLTPSELRVFRLLVLTEDKQAAIADELDLKLRTVQANVTSIYRKTGTATRSGLVQLYHDVQKQ